MNLSEVLEAWRARYGLTDAELEVLSIAIAEETSPAEIAVMRGVSPRTVKKQVQAICRKTRSEGLKDVVIRIFRERLWVEDEEGGHGGNRIPNEDKRYEEWSLGEVGTEAGCRG